MSGGVDCMSVYEALISLVGEPPAGYDILVWIFAAVVLLFLIRSAFSIISSVLDWIGGRRS